MTRRVPRAEWGGGALPPASQPWPLTGAELYLHHTVGQFVEPEEVIPEPEGDRPMHLGVLWRGDHLPGPVARYRIARRHGVSTSELETRRRGDGGFVVVRIDPVRVEQLRRKRRARRAANRARALPIVALEKRAMREIEGYHRSLGWIGVGYREVGFASGRLYEGRGDRHAAHCPGANHLPSIAMAGNYAGRTPTPKLRALVLERARALHTSGIVGHRQHPYPTSCPGVSDAWLSALNRDL